MAQSKLAPQRCDPNALYRAEVRAAITAVVRSGTSSFGALCRTLGEVDPHTVHEVVGDGLAMSEHPTAVSRVSGSTHLIPLPVPHPLDYDWRLNDASVTFMANALVGAVSTSQRILL